MLRRVNESNSFSHEVHFDILMTLLGLRVELEAQVVGFALHQILCKLNTTLSLQHTYPIITKLANIVTLFAKYNFDCKRRSTSTQHQYTFMCKFSNIYLLQEIKLTRHGSTSWTIIFLKALQRKTFKETNVDNRGLVKFKSKGPISKLELKTC